MGWLKAAASNGGTFMVSLTDCLVYLATNKSFKLSADVRKRFRHALADASVANSVPGLRLTTRQVSSVSDSQ